MKILLLIFFSIYCLPLANSQAVVGLKFGYNLTKPDFGNNKFDSQTSSILAEYEEFKGIHLGVFSKLNLLSKINLQTELFYIAKGFNPGSNSENSILYNSLVLPITFGYEILPKLNFRMGLELDYIFSYALNNGFDFRGVERINIDSLKRRFNFGYTFGLQYKLLKRWEIDLRYVRLIDERNDTLSNLSYTRTFMFSLNRYFGKKKK